MRLLKPWPPTKYEKTHAIKRDFLPDGFIVVLKRTFGKNRRIYKMIPKSWENV